MQPDSGMLLSSVRDVLHVIFRHKSLIAVFFVLIAAAVTVVTYLLPAAYESDVQLLIRLGRENMPGDPSVPGTMVNVTQDRTSEVKSEVAILSSSYLAEKVVDNIGEGWILGRRDLTRNKIDIPDMPEPGRLSTLVAQVSGRAKDILGLAQLVVPLSPRDEAIRRVKKNTEVSYEKQTNIVALRYEDRNPALAQHILNKLVEFYLERHVEVHTAQATPAFFQEQVAKLEADLKLREDELQKYKEENGISSISAQKENLLARISKLAAELSDVTADEEGLAAMVNTLTEIVKTARKSHELSRTTGMPNYLADKLKERVADLRERETEMAARYPDSYRPLVELREQLKLVQDALAREPENRTEVTTGLDANRESWEHTLKTELAQLEARRARKAKLAEEVEKHKGELAAVSNLETELVQLTRSRDLAEAEYKEYRTHLQRSQISAAMDVQKVSNVSVVQPASKPLVPVRPKKLRNIGLGLLLGLFGGIFFAFVREYFDDTLNTTEALEKRLGIPVLTSVSEKEFRACT